MRNFQLLSQLATEDDVTLLTFGGSDVDSRDVAALRRVAAEVHTVDPPGMAWRWKRQTQALAMLTPLPYQHLMFRSHALRRLIDGFSRERPFDLVQVEFSQLAQYDFGDSTPVVLDEHNIEYELLQRVSRVEASMVRKVYSGAEYLKVRRAEIRTWRRVAGCVFTSEREREIAAAVAPRTPCIVIANGVDVDFFQPAEAPARSENIVFTGTQDYRPNADAAAYFVRSILPLVLRERPGATFTIVGKDPPREVRELASAAVEVTGTVGDVRPHLAGAAVAVAPLRMGGGTRLKILEALAMGKAVVSTSIGCEGLNLRSGEHLLVADPPELFARRIVDLLSDRVAARALGESGRRFVEREHAWPTVAGRLREFHTEVLDRRRPQQAGVDGSPVGSSRR